MLNSNCPLYGMELFRILRQGLKANFRPNWAKEIQPCRGSKNDICSLCFAPAENLKSKICKNQEFAALSFAYGVESVRCGAVWGLGALRTPQTIHSAHVSCMFFTDQKSETQNVQKSRICGSHFRFWGRICWVRSRLGPWGAAHPSTCPFPLHLVSLFGHTRIS